MKKKIYKALSVVLAIIVAFSVCTCITGVITAAIEVTYYVKTGATGGDGTESNPYATVTDAITAANTANTLIVGDTLNIVALDDVTWGDANTPTHVYNVVVKSDESATTPSTITYENERINLGGATTIDNINLVFTHTSGSLFLYRYDFVLTKTASITVPSFYTGRSATTGEGEEYQSVVIDGSLSCSKKFVLGNEWNTCNYTGYLDITINDPAHAFNIYFGAPYGTSNYKNVRIDIKAATGVAFYKTGNFSFSENGSLQVINSSSIVLGLDDGGLADIDDNKKIIVNNTLGIKGLISFTDTNGKFAVASGYQNVKATSTGGTIDAINNELALTAGAVYNVTSDKIPESRTYYVKAAAEGGDGTEAKPFANIGEAVTHAIDTGLVANDTLNIKLLGNESIDWGIVVSYRFNLIIESNDIANKSTIIIPNQTNLTGLVEFRNLALNSTTYHSLLRFDFNKVVIGTGVTSDIREIILGNVTTSAEVNGAYAQFNFPFNGSNIFLGNEWSSTNFVGDVNIDVNNPSANIKFSLTSHNGKNTYKNLNFNIKNAASIQFVNAGESNGGSVDVTGVVQILNSAPELISANSGVLSQINSNKKYVINNISGDSNLLEYTDTVGKYKVNSEYEVYAVKAGTTDRILPVGGYLILEAGEYTVNTHRDAVVKEYYVSSNGITVSADNRPETAGNKDNPVLTIADATRLISQDPLSSVDTAKIIVKAGDTVYWGENAANCAPLLVIQSSSEGVQATVTNKNSYGLVANTVFRNVIIEITNNYQILRLNNYDVTFDTGSSFTSSTYVSLGTGTGKVVNKDINIVFKGVFNPRSFTFTSEWGSSTYNGDINVVIDSKETAFAPIMGGQADSTTVYNGNINITLLNAKTMNFKMSSNANALTTFNGSLQVLADSTVELPYAVKNSFNEFQVAGGKWYVTNYSNKIDLVQFSDVAGVFNIKDGKTVFVRDISTKKETKNTTGTVTLQSGQYMISDKNTPKVMDESHKMVHFTSAGNGKNYVYARFPVTAGKTYVYELSYYSVLQDNTYPVICEDGNRPILTDVTIISDKIVNNYHKVVCEFTVPKTYTISKNIFAGLQVGKSNEGVLFDQLIYEKGDASKTNVMLNNNFYDGLDEWALSMSFWGNHWTGERGGVGVLKFNIGVELLEVMNFDLDFIKELIASGNPQDGEWWSKKDIHEEVSYTAYTNIKGTFKDENGKPISGAKFVLVSTDDSYSTTTNAKGEFKFNKVKVNFYDLFLLDFDGNKIHTGYSAYLEEGTEYIFDIVSDMSAVTDAASPEDYITVEKNEDDTSEETVPSGSVSGIVYTPMRDIVPELKLIIDGVGEVVTDENGSFAFADVPVGTYELYTILSNGEKYTLKEITIVENNELALKLKYDPPTADTDTDVDNGWVIWVVIASVVALVVVGTLVVVLIVKKKKSN